MTPRFLLLTFASCIIVFATIWAATAPKSVPVAAVSAAPAVLYADCDAVRAANAAPLRADQPGYRAALDGNMNGIACEPVGGTETPITVDTALSGPTDAAPAPSAPPLETSEPHLDPYRDGHLPPPVTP